MNSPLVVARGITNSASKLAFRTRSSNAAVTLCYNRCTSHRYSTSKRCSSYQIQKQRLPLSAAPLTRAFCTSKMSDEEYTNFLDKANNTSALSTASTRESAQENSGFTANSVDTEVPQALSKLDAYYTSDSDEKFQPVSLSVGEEDLEGAIATGITDKVITKLTGHEEIESVAPDSFDPRGQYSAVLDAVRDASGGDARIFKITLDGARCEYWVLGLDKPNSRIVGVRAPAVES